MSAYSEGRALAIIIYYSYKAGAYLIKEAYTTGKGIRRWIIAKAHRHKASKQKSLAELLISLCYEEEEVIHYTKDSGQHTIVCELSTNTYRGISDPAQLFELLNALVVCDEDTDFISHVMSDSASWPTGIEYFIDEQNTSRLSIRAYIDIDYTNAPADQLRGYISYLRELQMDLLKNYNRFRADSLMTSNS